MNLPPDLAPLALPLPGAQACGPDLEYDARYFALERQIAASPDASLISAAGRAAAPTDWAAVQSTILSLLAETRDLRLGLYLVRARLRLDGPRAAEAAVHLLRGWVQRLWLELNPPPDPSDEEPEWPRAAALAAVWHEDGLPADWRLAREPAGDTEAWADLARALLAMMEAIEAQAPGLLDIAALKAFLRPWLGAAPAGADDEATPGPAPLAAPTAEQIAAVEGWLAEVTQWQAALPERQQAQALLRHRRERQPSLAALLQELKADRDGAMPRAAGAAPA